MEKLSTPRPNPCTGLEEKKAFFDALHRQETAAIRCLHIRLVAAVRQMVRNAGLPDDFAAEVVADSIVVTLSNISNGKFIFQEFSPTAYAMGVARNLVANRFSKKTVPTTPLDGLENLPSFDPDLYAEQRERETLVARMLGRLGESCQRLIRLKYFDGHRDEEIVRLKLTQYSTTATLKNKRSACLKKLAEIAETEKWVQVFKN